MLTGGDNARLKMLCESSSFPHKDEVLERIGKGGVVEWGDGEGVPAKSMLGIYEKRLNRGRNLYRDTKHANRLLRDTEAYINELRKVPEDRVRLWHVHEDDVFSYVLFEGTASERIFGCILVADKRKMSMEQWEHLWGTGEDT